MDIESKFLIHLADSLNAEICSGLITNMNEAFEWFRNTFLWVRLTKNPMKYGMNTEDLYKRLNTMNFDTSNPDALYIAWLKELLENSINSL